MTEVVAAEDLADDAAAWDALVDAAPLPSPFLRSWWLRATADDRARFVLVRDGTTLIGGVALEDRTRLGVSRVGFAGASRLAPDHLDLVAAAARGDETVAALREWLAGRGTQFFDLRGAAETARLRDALPPPVREERLSVSWFADLPDDPDVYLATRPGRLRSTVKRTTRRLERDGIRYRVVAPDDLEPALVRLRDLHERRWGAGTNFLRHFDAFAVAARGGTAAGELAIHELACDDDAIASLVTFDVAGRVSYYQSGRATDHEYRGSGTVLMARVVEDACRRGRREFDLLRGIEAYKQEWATDRRDVVRLVAASGPARRAVVAGAGGYARARRVASRARRRLSADKSRRLAEPEG